MIYNKRSMVFWIIACFLLGGGLALSFLSFTVKAIIGSFMLLVSLLFFVLYCHYNIKDDEEENEEDENKVQEYEDRRTFYDMSKVQYISEIEKVGDRFKFVISFGSHSSSFDSGSIKPLRQLRNLLVDGWYKSGKVSIIDTKDVKSDE